MTETKHYNVRGLNLDEIMRLVEKEIDSTLESKEEEFRIDMQDAGFPAADTDEYIEARRAEKIAWRRETLADMRRLLERRRDAVLPSCVGHLNN
jgi:vancomycin resistance protein YoaR